MSLGQSGSAVFDDWTTMERVLARGLWECLVASGADVSGYCPGGPSDPLWRGTPEEALEAGFDQWARMRMVLGMRKEAVEAVKQLRADYDEDMEACYG